MRQAYPCARRRYSRRKEQGYAWRSKLETECGMVRVAQLGVADAILS
ncbi:MAG: hypothetical protein GY820_09195 [Gammaproteobacteria bacterium]|nr:hypothetical protein [Gammaproteobacteria bacterium]